MKTLVTIAAGAKRGDTGWINGDLPRPRDARHVVLVHFFKRAFPRDIQRVPVSRLRVMTDHEARLCGVALPSVAE